MHMQEERSSSNIAGKGVHRSQDFLMRREQWGKRLLLKGLE